MATRSKPRLISVDEARRWWNGMSRKERLYVLDKVRAKINRKDVGEAGYYYGNLHPKTMQAIRCFLSGRS